MSKKIGFKEINQIDVSKHVEKKMNLSYLSWAWAHAEMKKIDENAEITIHEFPDTDALIELASKGVEITPELAETITASYKKDKAGAYVKVSVTLNGRTETEYLPVMDFKNKSMVEPDSMSINKAHKRCFVKALALHGLGLYIYAGEDLPEVPEVPKITKKQTDEIVEKIKEAANYMDRDDADVMLGRKLVGDHASNGNKVADIDKINYDKAINFLNGIIENHKPKEEKAEQTSLMEGNTTTPKGENK